MDSTRRTILTAGVAAAAAAAAPRLFGQQTGRVGKFYERGSVRIYYEETGSGFPLLLLPGGGLNATIGFFTGNPPFNAIGEFNGEYRCITADLRNAPSGQSTGPVEVDRPWESYADDQLGLMDHLGVDKFMVMGFCIGGPFIWSLLKRAPNRIAAAVLAQPVGWHPYAVAMECAMLAPNAEVSIFPWKEPKERIPLAVRQIRSFMRAHRPQSAKA
jgi:pimeloyl-ACP methyl ester carboxylesterase